MRTPLPKRCANALALLAAAAISASASEPEALWTDVTNDVGGPTWGAYGVTYMAPVPGKNAVIAGVSERGLWESADDGATWKQLGAGEIKNRPGRIVFDPKNSAIFWVSGCYGDSPFKTVDGGKTFRRLGALSHSDGIAVDFTDPRRSTLLLGLHEQSQALELSTDGGTTWTNVGLRLPTDSNHSSDPIILDSKTFLVNTAGWKQNASLGVYRTEDGGLTWRKVTDDGPAGQALLASDGAIYWQRLWGGGLLKSLDQGKTWALISNAVKSNLAELPRKRLAGLAERQMMISSDGGAHWSPYGPKAPFRPDGFAYSAKGRCFYVWRMSDNMTRAAESIARLSAG